MPELLVFIQLFLLTIAHAVLMVSAAIVFSIQSTSVKAANLMASFIIIPVALLMQGESALLFWGNNQVLWLAVVAVLIMAGLIVRLGLAHFQREYLLGREIDILNLRWMWRTFWGYFKGDAHSSLRLVWALPRSDTAEIVEAECSCWWFWRYWAWGSPTFGRSVILQSYLEFRRTRPIGGTAAAA